ncbi:MAG: hypothetical protein RJB66_2553 [Pseudomonadota bacterium]
MKVNKIALLPLIAHLQACTAINFQKLAKWESKSLIAYELNEDDSEKTFKLPHVDAPREYRILLDGEEVQASKDKPFLNGRLLTLNKLTGEFSYRPEPNYHGAQLVEFEVQDAMSGLWSHYAADLIVHPINDAPTAQDATIHPGVNKTFLVPIDLFKPSDIDNNAQFKLELINQDNLSVEELRRDATTLKIGSDGKSIEVVVEAFTGAMSIGIRINDGSNSSNEFVDVNLVVSPENPILDFKPALAVNKTQCLSCHSQVDGNFVTSLGLVDGKNEISFHNNGTYQAKMAYGEFAYGNWTDHGSKAFSLTTFIRGNVFVPHAPLDSAAKTFSKNIFAEATQTLTLTSSIQVSAVMDFAGVQQRLGLNLAEPQTGGQFLYATNRLRTPEYLKYLTNYGAGKTILPDTKFTEVKAISIQAPTEAAIKEKLRTGETMSFYPQDLKLPKLENFQLKKARVIDGSQRYIWGNDPKQTMKCNGDIFVDGAVYLEQLQLDTRSGCRIHATGTIFVSGRLRAPYDSATSLPKGFLLINRTEQSNLELSSASAILLGLGFTGKSPNSAGELVFPAHSIRTRISRSDVVKASQRVMDETYLLVGDESTVDDPALLIDAASTGREVQFERLLINAPIIHSRYTGDFKGVVIADFVLWSLGKFKYFYDDVFDRTPVFPMLQPGQFFEVKLCDTNKILKRDDYLSECNP